MLQVRWDMTHELLCCRTQTRLRYMHVGCKWINHSNTKAHVAFNWVWDVKHQANRGHIFDVKYVHTGYFSHISPFIEVSANVNMVCPGPPRQWDQTETSFSLKSFQAWRYDTAGTVRVQQKTVAGGHGWQGAGEELCLFVFEIFILCWLLFDQGVFLFFYFLGCSPS